MHHVGQVSYQPLPLATICPSWYTIEMTPETAQWLNEGRVRIEEVGATFTNVSSMSSHGAEGVFMAAEYALKAPLVERFGTLPGRYEHHRLVTLANRTGLWAELPRYLQEFVTDIAPYDPNVRYPGETAFETLVSSSTNAQWASRLELAQQLLDHVRDAVISDPSAMARLTL